MRTLTEANQPKVPGEQGPTRDFGGDSPGRFPGSMTWGFENVNIIFWLVVSTNGFQLVWLETPKW